MMTMRQITMILVFVLLLCGCTPEQAESVDHALADVNGVAGGLSDFAESEGGAWLPGEIRSGLVIAGLCATSALSVWQRVRGRLVRQAGSAVVAAIEGLPEPDKDKVKAAVKVEMVKREIYSKANEVVDRLKT